MTRRLSDQESNTAGFNGVHVHGCALTTRGGLCDCPPIDGEVPVDLRTTSRGMTYALAALLGEGIHDDEEDDQ